MIPLKLTIILCLSSAVMRPLWYNRQHLPEAQGAVEEVGSSWVMLRIQKIVSWLCPEIGHSTSGWFMTYHYFPDKTCSLGHPLISDSPRCWLWMILIVGGYKTLIVYIYIHRVIYKHSLIVGCEPYKDPILCDIKKSFPSWIPILHHQHVGQGGDTT